MDCIILISARCVVVRIRREVEQVGVLPGARRVEQILHHRQRAIVMLNHTRQKQAVKLRALRLSQCFHLLRRKHSGHQSPSSGPTYPCPAFPALPSEAGSPRAASQRFMNLISSDCELLIRAPSDLSILVLRMRRNQRRHLHRLRMMHDHALHELDVRVRPSRQRSLASMAAASCSAAPAPPAAPQPASSGVQPAVRAHVGKTSSRERSRL